STVSSGGTADEALDRLRAAAATGPVWVGPLEMGHLTHQPGMTGPIESDHFVVVLEVGPELVLLHDPHGHPSATLPVVQCLSAWRATTPGCGEPYTLRPYCHRSAAVTEEEALRAGRAGATAWLEIEPARPVPPGTLGNRAAAEALAELWQA